MAGGAEEKRLVMMMMKGGFVRNEGRQGVQRNPSILPQLLLMSTSRHMIKKVSFQCKSIFHCCFSVSIAQAQK